MTKNPSTLRQDGFTLVELVMAMAVFSFLLMMASFGFIQIVRIHQAGISSRSTQQNARLIMDELTKAIHSATSVITMSSATLTGYSRLCVISGAQHLAFDIDNTGNMRLGEAGAGCTVPILTNWVTKNDSSVIVTQFSVDTTPAITGSLGTAFVTLTVASNNNTSALNNSGTQCLPGPGAQFCSVTTLTTSTEIKGGNGL